MTLRGTAFSLSVALALVPGCNVYDPSLLNRETGPDSDIVSQDVNDVVDGSVGPDVIGGDVATDGASDAVPGDAADVATDAVPSCTALLAAGTNCIEPFSGQSFSPDDSRFIAPGAIAASADTMPRVAVADLGSARVMSYAVNGMMPRRLVGTGVSTVAGALGAGTATALGTPTGVAFLPAGDLLVADAQANGVYLLSASTSMVSTFGGSPYHFGPWAMQLLNGSASTMIVSADNRIYAVNITGDLASSPTPIIGMACGTSCPGFNSTAASATSTQLNFPTGIDSDAAGNIYIADSQNCRIRKATAATGYFTTVFAGGAGTSGNGCDATGNIYGSVGPTSVVATSAHLGIVGDVRVGADGTVYFTDLTHCAICSVTSSGTLTVVVGSPTQCNDTTGSVRYALGHPGGLGLSSDRSTLYFADQTAQDVGQLALGPGGPVGMPTFAIAPGVIPAPGDTIDRVRVGGVSGIAVSGAPASAQVYWAGAAEGRVYEVNAGTTTVVMGTGGARLTTATPAAMLESAMVRGMAFPDPPDGGARSGNLAVALGSRSVVGVATGTTVTPAAGMYNVSGPVTLTVAAENTTLDQPGWPIFHGGDLYFDTSGPNAQVFKLPGGAGGSSLMAFAGSGPTVDGGVPTDAGSSATSVALSRPAGLAFDNASNLYVADEGNHVVWRIASGTATVFAGLYGRTSPVSDGSTPAAMTAIPDPVALAFDGGHRLYVADNAPVQRIRQIDLTTGSMLTVAGAGTVTADYIDASTSRIGAPTALAFVVDRLYFGEMDSGRVRVLRIAP